MLVQSGLRMSELDRKAYELRRENKSRRTELSAIKKCLGREGTGKIDSRMSLLQSSSILSSATTLNESVGTNAGSTTFSYANC
jgi:hypothetical protein